MSACQKGEDELLRFLLSTTTIPDIGTRNAFGKSAAFYASSRKDVLLLRRLSSVSSPLNDGSLHEAARTLDATAVEFLCKAGHHPDFSSSLRQGRSALLEAMLKSYVDTPKQARHLTAVVNSLRKAGASPAAKYEGKCALFCALDDPCAVQAVKVLLDTDEWKDINAEHNLNEDEQGHCFSATMYLQYGLSRRDKRRGRGRVDELLTILRQRRCEDRYFVRHGEQPSGATGMPCHLRIAHEKRQQEKMQSELEEQRHKQQLARQRQSAAVELEGVKQRHALSQEQERERERQRLARLEAMEKEAQRRADIEERKRLAQIEAMERGARRQAGIEKRKALARLEAKQKEENGQADIEGKKRLAQLEALEKEQKKKAEIEESQHQHRLVRQRQSAAVELENTQQKHVLTFEHDRERASEKLKKRKRINIEKLHSTTSSDC